MIIIIIKNNFNNNYFLIKKIGFKKPRLSFHTLRDKNEKKGIILKGFCCGIMNIHNKNNCS
jgi:hypothetical protein